MRRTGPAKTHYEATKAHVNAEELDTWSAGVVQRHSSSHLNQPSLGVEDKLQPNFPTFSEELPQATSSEPSSSNTATSTPQGSALLAVSLPETRSETPKPDSVSQSVARASTVDDTHVLNQPLIDFLDPPMVNAQLRVEYARPGSTGSVSGLYQDDFADLQSSAPEYSKLRSREVVVEVAEVQSAERLKKTYEEVLLPRIARKLHLLEKDHANLVPFTETEEEKAARASRKKDVGRTLGKCSCRFKGVVKKMWTKTDDGYQCAKMIHTKYLAEVAFILEVEKCDPRLQRYAIKEIQENGVDLPSL